MPRLQKNIRDIESGLKLTENSEMKSVVFYWRPGCGFCMSLQNQLSAANIPLEFRNIWEEPDAASFVRANASGNEIVPTLSVGTTVLVNPSAGEVLDAMRDQVPHLIPAT